MPTRIDPHAAGSTRHSQWWVIYTVPPSGPRNITPGDYSAIMATSRPDRYVAGPFTSQSSAKNYITNASNAGGIHLPNLNPFSWLGSLGGMIGSGIESGFITAIKDLWDVVIGPLEVLIGGIIIVVTLMMYFRHDIINLASSVGSMAAMAA